MKDYIVGILTIVGFIGLMVGLSLLLAIPLSLAWNHVMPYLFGFKTITWGQAWCLSLVSSMLFKSISSSEKK